MHQQTIDTLSTLPSPDEIRAELDSVLSSQGFRRSERLSHFLRFVCEMTLNGEASTINEYLIAHEVFGRGPEYSRGEDCIVRRRAHTLRQKLHEYYAGYGKDDAVRIELPVGHYIPVFTRTNVSGPQQAEEPATPQILKTPWNKTLLYAASATLVIAAFFTIGWFFGRVSARASNGYPLNPAVAEIWSAWLADESGAVICFSNPITAVVKQFPLSLPPNSQPPRFPMPPEEAKFFRESLDLPPGGFLYLSPAIAQAKMGEAVGSIALVALFAGNRVPIRATQSRFLSWDDFRNNNLILLGHDEANKWLDPILRKLPLRLATTDGEKQRRIVNISPKDGEASEYQIQFPAAKGQPAQDYALISMLAGIDNRHRLLLVNGLNTEGTQMALEYLTKPASAQELLDRLRKIKPNHSGPWYFQAVLRTEVRDKVPTRADLIAIRVP
jgi:hypothetical protein